MLCFKLIKLRKKMITNNPAAETHKSLIFQKKSLNEAVVVYFIFCMLKLTVTCAKFLNVRISPYQYFEDL